MRRFSYIGKWIFASVFFIFGLMHFGPLEYSLPYVPDYFPFRPLWVYASGIGLMACSLSAWIGKLDRLAALLLALMMLTFVLLVHLPGAIQGEFVSLIGVFRDTAMMGAALMYADAYAGDDSYPWQSLAQ